MSGNTVIKATVKRTTFQTNENLATTSINEPGFAATVVQSNTDLNEINEEIGNSNSFISSENNSDKESNNTVTKSDYTQKNGTIFSKHHEPVKLKTKSDRFVKPLLKRSVQQSDSNNAGGPNKGLLMVLCFFIPWLAVGLATNWDLKPLIFNLLWSLTCIGGIIHALVVVSREA